MEIKQLTYGLVALALLWGCRKNDPGRPDAYLGPQKHPQPAEAVFPASADAYDIRKPLTGALKDSLNTAVREIFRVTSMPGISAAMLVADKGLWQLDTGFISRPKSEPVDSTTIFYWASVGKFVTVTITEQLIAEQKLSYDSRLSQWFPAFASAGKITIRQLLEHTTGIYSFNNDPSEFSIDRYYAPDELLAIAIKHGPLFSPGQYWSYSNTGYLLLALIAEKIEGESFDMIVQRRIARPFGLPTLRALKPGELPVRLALAHEKGGIIHEEYSVPLGAGNIVSNARDMVVLLYRLMTGPQNTLASCRDRMAELYPMPDKGMWYGRGIVLFDFNAINQTDQLWIGHSGGTQTYRALIGYDSVSKAFFAFSINQHVSVEAVAGKLLAIVGKVK